MQRTVKSCSVTDCPKESKATGLCSMHYARKRKRNNLGQAHSERQPRTGVCAVRSCKQPIYGKGLCSKHWQRMRAKGTTDEPTPKKEGCVITGCKERTHFAKGYCKPHYMKDTSLRKWYKIDLTQYLDLLKAQDSRCAICRSKIGPGEPRAIHVDHSHKTGKVREILCHSCNTGLGHFREDSRILMAAIKYLKKHKG